MSRLFLSHSSLNNPEAVAVKDWLAENGWDDVFLDLDPERGIVAGERWERALSEAANRCEAVIFLVSRAWLASHWCLREFHLARRLNKRMFGVLIEDIPLNDLPRELPDNWQIVNLAAGTDHEMRRATLHDGGQAHVTFSSSGLKRLRAGLAKAGLDPRFFAWPPRGEPERAPYCGLKALEAEDAGIFFGRDAQVIQGLDALRGLADTPPPRLMVILGASGAGKSSFLRAGLWPRLKRDDRNFLPLPVIRPERGVVTGETGLIRSLETALKAAGMAWARADIKAAVDSGPETVGAMLAELAAKATPPALNSNHPAPQPPAIVISIDQGEELFLGEGAAESAAFLSLMSALLTRNAPRILGLVTIRSDRYERLQTEPALEGIRQHTTSLAPLMRGAYGEVIEGPARRLAGTQRALTVEPSLTASLLADIEAGGAKDSLPLLAFTLERLYLEHGGDGKLSLADYEALGRVKGSIEAAVETALKAADADPAVPKDREERIKLMRRGLVPWLAGIDPDTGSPRRRVARLAEIPEEARPLIGHLVEARLLSTDRKVERDEATGAEAVTLIIEPAHEALLRQWGLLEGWLAEDFGALIALEGVKRAASEWTANARRPGWLSHKGGRLEEAEKQAARPEFAAYLDAEERAYLAACRIAELAELRDKRRKQQIITYGSLVSTAVFAMIAATAIWLFIDAEVQREKAEAQRQQAQLAQSRYLAGFAEERLQQGHLDNAVGLAREALPVDLGRPDRPVAPEALTALYSAYTQKRFGLRSLRGHTGALSGALQLQDGGLLTWSKDMTARLWATDGTPGVVLEGHKGEVAGVLQLRDSRLLTWGSEDKTPRLWATDGTPGPLLQGHKDEVAGALQLQDGGLLTWGAKTVRLWATDGTPGLVLKAHEGQVAGVLQLKDGRLLTWGAQTVRLWATDGTPGRVLQAHEDRVAGVLQLQDGRLLTWGAKTVKLWATDGTPGPVLQGHVGVVSSALQLQDGRLLIWSDIVRLWAADGTPGAVLQAYESGFFGALQLQDGRLLTWGSWDTLARVWAADGTPGPVLQAHEGRVDGVLQLQDGRLLTWGSEDKTPRLWAADGTPGPLLQGHESQVSGALQLRDGRLLTWSKDKTARLWAVDGTPRPLLQGHGGGVSSALQLQDGRLLIWSWDNTFSGDTTPRLWGADGTPGPVLPAHVGSTYGALQLQNGRLLTWGGNIARLWAADGTPGPVLQEPESQISGALQLPDGRLFTWSVDETVRFWAADGTPGPVLQGHGGGVSSALQLQDGRLLTWSRNRTARLWAADGVPGPLLQGLESRIFGALQLQNGRFLTWGSHDEATRRREDQTAQLWSADGTPGPVLGGHEGQVSVLQLQDSRLLTWSEGETARLWAADGTPGPVLQGHKGQVFGALQLKDSRLLTWSADETIRLWTADGTPGPVLQGYQSGVSGALELQDGRLFTWGGNTARLWAADGTPGPLLQGHENGVSGALLLQDGRLLTWSKDDEAVRLWPLVEQILIWADRYIEDLGPLSPAERCQYYLKPDTACNRAAQ